MRQPDETVSSHKACRLTAQLMDGAVFMSQNGKMLNALVEFFNHQIDDLDKLLAEKNETLS